MLPLSDASQENRIRAYFNRNNRIITDIGKVDIILRMKISWNNYWKYLAMLNMLSRDNNLFFIN